MSKSRINPPRADSLVIPGRDPGQSASASPAALQGSTELLTERSVVVSVGLFQAEWRPLAVVSGGIRKANIVLDPHWFRANFGVPLRGSADIPPIDH
jgi:hypothetical protein